MKTFYLLLTTILFSLNIQAQQTPFITTWEVTSGNLDITIPTSGTGYDYTIDFGDGTILNNQTGNASHTYSAPGVYTVNITGDFPRIYFNNIGDKTKILSVEQWGDIQWQSMERAFHGCSNLVVNAVDAPDLSQVSSMRSMFEGAASFNQDINHWNVSSVTSMDALFKEASSFNQPLNNWDVSNVTNMGNPLHTAGGMFEEATSFNQPLNNWDVSSVVSMGSLFRHAVSFDQPLNNWNVSNVVEMGGMFNHAITFNQDLSDWNFNPAVSLEIPLIGFLVNSGLNTVNYDVLLARFVQLGLQNKTLGAVNLTYCDNISHSQLVNNLGWTIWGDFYHFNCNAVFPVDAFLTNWRVSVSNLGITIPTSGSGYNYTIDFGDGMIQNNVTGDSSHTYSQPGVYTVSITGNFPRINFLGATDASKLISIEQWGDIQWQTMENSFYNCSNLVINATDAPDLSQVTNMSQMFRGASSLNQSINHWDVSNVTNMGGLFENAYTFNQPLNNWDVSNVSSMQRMFLNATAFNRPLNSWNVSSVTDLVKMFQNATSFNQPIDTWNVSNITNMSSMFEGAALFNHPIDIWNVSSVTNMSRMFLNATSFNQPLDTWNVSNVTHMHEMFESATSFNQPLDSWNVSNVSSMNDMFNNATSFDQDISSWNFRHSVSLGNFLSNTNLSVDNYDALLFRILERNVSSTGLGAIGLEYCDTVTRNILVNEVGFTINGDSQHINCYVAPTTSFVTKWQVTSQDLTITIPTTGSGYNYTINFGDGLTQTNVTGDASHTYNLPGLYSVVITGDFPGIYFNNTGDKSKIRSVLQWGTNPWQSMENAFYGCESLTILATDTPDLNQVTNMSNMFHAASSMNQPVDHWDVSNVENMAGLFSEAISFNQPLANWDVSNVFNAEGMFENADSFNQPINNWDVSSMVYATTMFKNAVSFNQPLDNWDVSNVVEMSSMFENTPFNQVINNWNVYSVENMAAMFKGTLFYNQPLDNWDVSNVTDMTEMFSNAYSFNKNISNWNFNTSILLSGFLSNSYLSVGHYDSLLAKFVSLNLQNKTLDADGLTYCDDISRDELINNLNWNITGDSLDSNCTFANAFVTLWSTAQGGLSITIPTIGSGYNYTVDFGDGTVLTDVTGDVTHTYTQQFGIKTVSITGDFPRIYLNGLPNSERQKLIGVSQWGNIQWQSMSYAFAGGGVNISASDAPDLSQVTDMSYMFFNSSINSNINHWDVSNVTDMSNMFLQAASFNRPLNNWDVSNVQNMSHMFHSAAAFNQPLDNWDVSSVTDMSFLFSGSTQDGSLFNQPLNSWDVSNVTNMEGMFREAYSFNQPLNNWDVSSVTNMGEMFRDAIAFDQPLNNWDVSSVTNMSQMFSFEWGPVFGAGYPFNQSLNNWDVSSVTDMSAMFYGAAIFNQPLNNWDVSNVTDMNYMFFGTASFNQPIDNWDVSNVTNMNGMFAWSDAFNQPLNNWDVSSVVDMGQMFWNADVFNQPLNNWDVSGVTEMGLMFHGSNFNHPINSWDVSSVTSMINMFTYTPFNQPLYDWDVSNVLNMTGMFYDASNFNQDLSDWDFNTAVYLDFPGFGGFVAKSGLDVDNYDALLARFVNLGLTGKNFDAESLIYCDETSHNYLTNNLNWNITGDTLSAGCNMYDDPFVTTWEVVAGDLSISVPVSYGSDYGIDFGDGTVVFPVSGPISHTYDQPGIYTVTMGGSINSFSFSSSSGDQDKLLSVETWGNNQWQTMYNAFNGCSNLVINATDAPDLSQVTNMIQMFQNATSLNQSIDHWDVSNVENMWGVFSGATSFNQPLNSWDVSNVTNMYKMFENATSFNQSLDNWGVSNVENMSDMFREATSFNQSLNSWDVSNVTNMYKMFENATSFNQPLNNWNISNVTIMYAMFNNAYSFNQDISDWNFNSSVDLHSFLNNSNLDIQNYDALLYGLVQSGVQNRTLGASGLKYCDKVSRDFLINNQGWNFNGDSFFNACDIYNGNPFVMTWEVSADDLSITIPTTGNGYDYGVDFGDGIVADNLYGNTSHTFAEPGIYTVKIAGDFPRIYFATSQDKDKIQSVEQWGSIEWETMERAFVGCENLTINATDAPNLSQVTDMSFAFANATSFNQPINHWDVSNITNMRSTFLGATSFNQLLDSWDVSKVTNMQSTFENASSFNQSFENWNVSIVTNMSDMFKNAGAFNQDLSIWNFHKDILLDGFLSNSGLDTEYYDKLLAHFAESGITNKTLGADNLIYCEPEDRNQLINDMGWIIIGDEQDETCILYLPENQMESIVIYPVPTNDVLYIHLPKEIKIKKIKMYDIQGKVIRIIEGLPQEISVENLASGSYFLMFYGENKYHVKQFIKK